MPRPAEFLNFRRLAGLFVAIVLGLMSVPFLTGPAAAGKSVACKRTEELLNTKALVTNEVIELAEFHCGHNPNPDEKMKLRPKNEWAYPPGRVCDAVSFGVYSPPQLALPDEKVEAQCIASWYEYGRYADAHPDCIDKINALFKQQQIENGSEEERPDLSIVCPDAGNHKSQAKDNTDDLVLGAFGIGGWLCIAVVFVAVMAGVSVGYKYK